MLHSICQQIWKTHQWSQDWKRSVFIPIPKKGNAKNVQTTIQLCSFHTLPRLCSKSFKLDFSSLWTENFQVYKLDLETVEKPDIKLPTYAGSQKKVENPRKTSTSASLTTLKSLCGSQQTVEILQELGTPDHLTCLLRNLYAGQEATVRHGTTDWFKIGKGVCQGCILSPCLFNLYNLFNIMRNAKLESRLPGEISITSDMQMISVKWRETKEPLDERKSLLKTQHSKN